MSLRTPLSQAKGLGSAKEGGGHWWMQRMTSVALVPLTIWFAFSIASLGDVSYSSVEAWMQSPIVASLLAALVIAMFYHLQLGAQVIIEDYVHSEGLKIASIIALNLACIVLAIMGLLSILKVAL